MAYAFYPTDLNLYNGRICQGYVLASWNEKPTVAAGVVTDAWYRGGTGLWDGAKPRRALNSGFSFHFDKTGADTAFITYRWGTAPDAFSKSFWGLLPHTQHIFVYLAMFVDGDFTDMRVKLFRKSDNAYAMTPKIALTGRKWNHIVKNPHDDFTEGTAAYSTWSNNEQIKEIRIELDTTSSKYNNRIGPIYLIEEISDQSAYFILEDMAINPQGTVVAHEQTSRFGQSVYKVTRGDAKYNIRGAVIDDSNYTDVETQMDNLLNALYYLDAETYTYNTKFLRVGDRYYPVFAEPSGLQWEPVSDPNHREFNLALRADNTKYKWDYPFISA